jgi:capsid protein
MTTRIEALERKAARAKLERQMHEDKVATVRAKSELGRVKNYVNKNVRGGPDRQRGWTIIGPPERDFQTFDRRSIIAQARQKLEESPLVYGMIQTDMDNTIGSGFRLEMRTTNKQFNETVERLWAAEKDCLDVRGERSWCQLQRLWDTRRYIDGDVALLLDAGEKKGPDGRVPSYVQTIEADRIYKNIADAYDSGRDFDDFGRCVKYYFGPRQKALKPQTQIAPPDPYDADRVIFYINHGAVNRVERERGMSAFVTLPNIVTDLEEILEAMLCKVKNEAFAALKFKTIQTAPDGPWATDQEQTKDTGDGSTRRFVKMVRGTNFDLDPNEDVELVGMASPNSDFIPFVRFLIRIFGLPLGMPLEMILMDPSETNYSGLRSLLEFAKKRFRVAQNEAAMIASKVFCWWLQRQIELNGLKVPADIKGMHHLHSWILPSWPYLDPYKEAAAQDLMLKNGTLTPQDIIENNTEMSFEAHIAKLEQAKNEYERIGFKPAWVTDVVRFKPDEYGQLVRAGVITPQSEDEAYVRSQYELPPISKGVQEDWDESGNARRPITLTQETPPAPAGPPAGTSVDPKLLED